MIEPHAHVLVTAASRHTATAEIAQTIAAGLIKRGVPATSLPIGALRSVESYGAAVIGSAVYMGRWLTPAKRLIELNASPLLRMPVWLFSSDALGPPDHLIASGELPDGSVMARLIEARAHRMFAGRLDRTQLELDEALPLHVGQALDADYRDWGAVDAYCGEIAGELLAPELAV